MGRGWIRRARASASALLTSAVALVVYGWTLLPGVGWWDVGEMQTVASVLGIAHPTGYPVYTLLGHVFASLPLISPAVALNLFSALSAAAAVGVAAQTAIRVGVSGWLALPVMLLVAFALPTWESAVRAEVHTLHMLFVALLLHRLVVWRQEQRRRDLLIGALLLGLSFGNHMLTLAVAPFILLGVVGTGVFRRPRLLVASAFCFAGGLASYLYLPLRSAADPPMEYRPIDSLDSFFLHVSGREFSGAMAFMSVEGIGRFIGGSASWLVEAATNWTLPLVIGAAVGALVLGRRDRTLTLAMIGVAAGALFIMAGYQSAYIERYALATWLVMGALAALGAQALAERLGRSVRPVPAAALPLLLLVPVLGLLAVNLPRADQHDNREAQVFSDRIFEVLPASAVLVTFWDAATPLRYGQLVEGRRPDLLVVTWPEGAEGAVNSEVMRGRPVFGLQLEEERIQAIAGDWLACPVEELRVGVGRVRAEREYGLYAIVPPDGPGAEESCPGGGGERGFRVPGLVRSTVSSPLPRAGPPDRPAAASAAEPDTQVGVLPRPRSAFDDQACRHGSGLRGPASCTRAAGIA